MITIKLHHPPTAQTRRLSFSSVDSVKWLALALQMEALFSISAQDAALSYVDSDGDEVVLNSDAELEEVLRSQPFQADGKTNIWRFNVMDLSVLRGPEHQSETSPVVPPGSGEEWHFLFEPNTAAAPANMTPPHIELLSDTSSVPTGASAPEPVVEKSETSRSSTPVPTFSAEEKGKGRALTVSPSPVHPAQYHFDRSLTPSPSPPPRAVDELSSPLSEIGELGARIRQVQLGGFEDNAGLPRHTDMLINVGDPNAPMCGGPVPTCGTWSSPPAVPATLEPRSPSVQTANPPTSIISGVPTILEDVNHFINLVSHAFESHPELSEGWKNLVKKVGGNVSGEIEGAVKEVMSVVDTVVKAVGEMSANPTPMHVPGQIPEAAATPALADTSALLDLDVTPPTAATAGVTGTGTPEHAHAPPSPRGYTSFANNPFTPPGYIPGPPPPGIPHGFIPHPPPPPPPPFFFPRSRSPSHSPHSPHFRGWRHGRHMPPLPPRAPSPPAMPPHTGPYAPPTLRPHGVPPPPPGLIGALGDGYIPWYHQTIPIPPRARSPPATDRKDVHHTKQKEQSDRESESEDEVVETPRMNKPFKPEHGEVAKVEGGPKDAYTSAFEAHKRARESRERLEAAKAKYKLEKERFRADKDQWKKDKEALEAEMESKRKKGGAATEPKPAEPAIAESSQAPVSAPPPERAQSIRSERAPAQEHNSDENSARLLQEEENRQAERDEIRTRLRGAYGSQEHAYDDLPAGRIPPPSFLGGRTRRRMANLGWEAGGLPGVANKMRWSYAGTPSHIDDFPTLPPITAIPPPPPLNAYQPQNPMAGSNTFEPAAGFRGSQEDRSNRGSQRLESPEDRNSRIYSDLGKSASQSNVSFNAQARPEGDFFQPYQPLNLDQPASLFEPAPQNQQEYFPRSPSPVFAPAQATEDEGNRPIEPHFELRASPYMTPRDRDLPAIPDNSSSFSRRSDSGTMIGRILNRLNDMGFNDSSRPGGLRRFVSGHIRRSAMSSRTMLQNSLTEQQREDEIVNNILDELVSGGATPVRNRSRAGSLERDSEMREREPLMRSVHGSLRGFGGRGRARGGFFQAGSRMPGSWGL